MLLVERRKEFRYPANRRAQVRILSEESSGSDIELPCVLLNMSGQGVSIRLDRAIPASAAVRIDLNDSILLGEVCHCEPSGDSFDCGVRLDQALTSVTDLARLMSSIMGESARNGSRVEIGNPENLRTELETARRFKFEPAKAFRNS